MHRAGALRRAQASGVEVLLAIQDTTTFNFDTRKALEGLGSIGANNVKSSTSGLLVHSTLLTAADRDQVYGLLGAKIYTREPDKRKAQAPGTRNREPIEAKESIRWLESFTLAREAQQALKELTAADSPQAPSPLIVSVWEKTAGTKAASGWPRVDAGESLLRRSAKDLNSPLESSFFFPGRSTFVYCSPSCAKDSNTKSNSGRRPLSGWSFH